ncbi:3-ketoacyl-ACP reductase [Parasedimentitalea huanghaiensis]|uniref:3-ketoacyl-ACP reductase n=1 Tax=Parasedimentitalea huanghaiensis TaxID=2682100 RepID=A0A6L6WHK3_9RHOB|nr:3-ketoacyl-ACP reductase [Zongyanglinia huanghaiensis]MVO17296.1 3-ketoacyl-ACP reductase [Zongyanglinia huanghaiensis]
MSSLALITGGQTGIGLGIARVLVAQGWQVALASSSSEDSPAVQDALTELGDAASYYQHDLRDTDAVPNLLDRIKTQQGEIDSLISNAGVPARVRGDMLDMLPENWDFTLDINLRGAFFLAQSVARRMINAPSDAYRSIIFVTSVSADMVSVERAEYCISKAGAGMMAQLFAARLASEGIGVFELRPGIIETGMTAGVKDKYTSRIEAGLVPAARWGQPADIGSVVSPLVSGQMQFANGAVIPVDGGLSIHRL